MNYKLLLVVTLLITLIYTSSFGKVKEKKEAVPVLIFYLVKLNVNDRLFVDDGVHLIEKGYAIWKEVIKLNIDFKST